MTTEATPGALGSNDQLGLAPERAKGCAQGCNGRDDCTDYYCGDEYGDEPHGPPEYGCCLPPGECCMPGLHFPSECHTAADYERAHPLDWRRADEVRADWEAELRRDAFGA